ncbi:TetR/AcrR family transcriptional repressor of nem operon [Lewinella marina]|uniref:TetR family transcriptional regulator n=1 Tax=Neolewinella marina TaxID=438751 RepID=A0A2G0CEH1_9BACT|nr:TetR/AcrR family transcriptional regulator [Neolewinella marina]NJB87298.1 TetR/AcrR family transcriptional repressor of nem operon [Neolewinella marina]PHK98381.1 TetR family transcriptional regulator [Neolewinella marina]
MPRSKQYKEEEVVEKAMHVFWRHGYGGTSVRMLEKEMGINQFSIYASFRNKRGVLLASLRHYQAKMLRLVDKLEASPDGVAAIKAYFHDFLDFALAHRQRNGCLLHNTLGELAAEADPAIQAEITPFVDHLRRVLKVKLAAAAPRADASTLDRRVNYLMVALQGLTAGSKVFDRNQLNDYIEVSFEQL